MPSPVGHALAGAAIGLLTLPTASSTARSPLSRWRWPLIAAAFAVLPDADLLLPYAHRTGSHSVTAVAVVLIVAIGVTRWVTGRKVEGRRLKAENRRLKAEGGRLKEARRRQKAEGRRLKEEGGTHAVKVGCGLALAYASHLLLDWLGADPNPPSGIQLLWPFSKEWFISGWDLFPGTERRLGHANLIATNVHAFSVEIALLVPVLAAAWWITRRRRSRDRTSAPDIPLPPSA